MIRDADMPERMTELELLLRRLMPRRTLFELGSTLAIPYFSRQKSEWDIDEEKAAAEIAANLADEKLDGIFKMYKHREWETFRGKYFTFEKGEFRLEGSMKNIQSLFEEINTKYGKNFQAIIKTLLQSAKGCSLKEIQKSLPPDFDPRPILSELEKRNVIIASYRNKSFIEWALPEEMAAFIREMEPQSKVQGVTQTFVVTGGPPHTTIEVDVAAEERKSIAKMDRELNDYLVDLLRHRLEETLQFGRSFSISYIADYLRQLFGPILFFDSLLSITQQYGLADVEIVHSKGRTGMRTGWNLSLFGEPGTGKSFSVRDMILGKPDAKIPAHGIPGRNRYAGGITPAKFIRIGQAYSGRVFNFIVPEFNDWFKYKGMVEPLKLAMERGDIKYETQRETVGPYRFSGFFSVNYNVATTNRGYDITVSDPNFGAIEDRMLCRLHRLTKERYVEIAESQMRLALGEIDIEKGANKTRDHLALVYAIQTKHPLISEKFRQKPVMLTYEAQEMFTKARKAILEEIQDESVPFSARLEDRAIRFACAASMLSYFQTDEEFIPISDEALRYAVQLYVEEASVRSGDQFAPEIPLSKLI